MDLSVMINDLKAHFEQGAQLLESHLPGLEEFAGKVANDPLVQTAIDLAVPDTTRVMLAGFLKSVEAEVAKVEADARAAAEADAAAAAAAPAEPPPA